MHPTLGIICVIMCFSPHRTLGITTLGMKCVIMCLSPYNTQHISHKLHLIFSLYFLTLKIWRHRLIAVYFIVSQHCIYIFQLEELTTSSFTRNLEMTRLIFICVSLAGDLTQRSIFKEFQELLFIIFRKIFVKITRTKFISYHNLMLFNNRSIY